MTLSSPSSPTVPVLTLTFSGIILFTQAIQEISEPRDIYIFTPGEKKAARVGFPMIK
jgi:hypothetical protein